jgi:hypothetical protein
MVLTPRYDFLAAERAEVHGNTSADELAAMDLHNIGRFLTSSHIDAVRREQPLTFRLGVAVFNCSL